jgi:hypothetical protein
VSGDLGECARSLVQAVFRLAFCDYVGIAYGYDEPYPDKYTRINRERQVDAARFLTSWWAVHLGDLAGYRARTVWKQAQRDHLHRPVRLMRNGKGSESGSLSGDQTLAPSPRLQDEDRRAA